jgi:DNA-binding protein HU-beta
MNGITETFIDDRKITLPNFGSFKIKTNQSRMVRDLKTGKPVRLPSRKVIRFRAAKKLKDQLLPKK